MDRHRRKLATARDRSRGRNPERPRIRSRARRPADGQRDARHSGRDHIHDSPDGSASDPVHRVWARGIIEGRADHFRCRTVSHSRHGTGGFAPAQGAIDQGPIAWRVHLAGGNPGGAAPDHATPHRSCAPPARPRLSVPHLGRGHRGRCRSRLSHLPDAAISLDGCDPALCGLDHLAGIRHGLCASAPRASRFLVGLCGGAALMSALSLRNVWVEYGDQIVLERINLEIASGAFISVVGPSGAGKSTFLRLILGQEQPTRGTILLDGTPLPPEPGPDRGVVFQRYSVFPHLSVLRNVLIAYEFEASKVLGQLAGKARRDAIAKSEHLLEGVGLAAHRDKYPSALSGGMQQRLAIAQALARRPRVLLLDEPFGALDPGTRAEMHRLIVRLWREHGFTVIMVTHDIREAFQLGTRLITLDHTRLDPHAPGRYGAIVTYDLDLSRGGPVPIPRFSKPLDPSDEQDSTRERRQNA